MSKPREEHQESQPHDSEEVDELKTVQQRLHTRFGNRDGVGVLPERLGPLEIQWLARWFTNCGHCEGCEDGYFLEVIAPIFDSKIDLWARRHLESATSRRMAIHALSC
ncbi:MAG: hypothetical protein OSB12_10875, partial [Planctomycetota bacterium]|nr:hypothetical protein [Planctomycetota bacterium]